MRMNKYLIIYIVTVTFLNSCVNTSSQQSYENQSTLDPVLTQIILLVEKKESGRLTEYQEKQLPSFEIFKGQKIAASGKVLNVSENGMVSIMGDGLSLLRPTPFINYKPKDPASTISMSRDQQISVKGTITAVEHSITSLGWHLAIYVSE
jgi:hypothetical protein